MGRGQKTGTLGFEEKMADTFTLDDSGIETEPLDKIRCSQCGSRVDLQGLRAFSLTSCPACGTQLVVPAQFASYILLDQIGVGGMGAVYRALDPALDRIVGLKVLLRSIGQVPASVEVFQKEAKAAARLNHPCVAHIYAFGVEKGQPYIAMEFVEGQSLSALQGVARGDLVLRARHVGPHGPPGRRPWI